MRVYSPSGFSKRIYGPIRQEMNTVKVEPKLVRAIRICEIDLALGE